MRRWLLRRRTQHSIRRGRNTVLIDQHIPDDFEASDMTLDDPNRRDPIEDLHGRWTIRIIDDQPIADGKQYAADNRVEVLHDGTVFKEFLYPSYRIWTLLAHWKDGVDPTSDRPISTTEEEPT